MFTCIHGLLAYGFPRHSQTLARSPNKAYLTPRVSGKRHVLITGSTGFVGSYVLNAIKHQEDVGHVTCLDRRETRDHAIEGVYSNVPIEHIKTDLAERHLGLSREIYQRLLGSVTDILHCQWAVDFSRPLAYFEPNIAGVKNLITFAHEARDKVHFIFLSSVATVKRWNSKTAVSETCLPSPKIAETGYGLSKVIAVRLLDQAVQGASMRVSICRLGQVAGPIQDGRDGKAHAWPLRDWFPTLLSSSVALGCLPDSLGSADQIDWLPVDTVADLLCDIISLSQHQQKNQQGSEYFHLVNPHRVQYASLVSCLAARLRLLNPELEVVPLSQWVAALEEKVNKAECIAGVQLLSFFQGLADASYQGSVLLETTLTKKRLPRLEECPPISPRCIDMWLRQWEMVPPSRKD